MKKLLPVLVILAAIAGGWYWWVHRGTADDGQLTLYRLLPGREIAERTVVQTGRASVNQIEIVGGLEAGDRIILSDTSDWQDQSRIHID